MNPIPSSEDEILACLARYFPKKQPSILLGRGDDCALLQTEHPLSVSTDLFLEHVHFRRSYFSAEEIGYKALAVNLSDLAACGARPLGFTLSLGLPKDVDSQFLEAVFAGMANLAQREKISLVGGDLSRSSLLTFSITVFGEIAGASCFLPRGGSMLGDTLFLIGEIGLAHVGLHMLEHFGRSAKEQWPMATKAHLTPRIHLAAGQVLARAAFNARPPALMDVSDGIVRDLPRLLGMSGELAIGSNEENCLGAVITLSHKDLHPEVLRFCQEQHVDPVLMALSGGEDYALLGTCAPDLLPTLRAAIPEFMVLGTITNNGRILYNGLELPKDGFDHFLAESVACGKADKA